MTGLYHVGQKCQKIYGPVCIRKHLSIQHFFSKMAFKKQMLFFRNGRALHAGPAAAVTVEDDGGGKDRGGGATSTTSDAGGERQVKGGGDACIQRRRVTL
jgi:hypothetical protein